MGPIMNLGLAFLVMALVLYQGAQVPVFEQQPVIVGALENASAAKAAGVLVGDHIVSVDGTNVDTWEQFYTAVGGKAKRELSLGIDRGGQHLDAAHGGFGRG